MPKTRILIAPRIALLVLPFAAGAQSWSTAWRTISMTEENDALGRGDSAYTQGLRFSSERGYYPVWTRRLAPRFAWASPAAFDTGLRASFGKANRSCNGYNDVSGWCGFSSLALVQTEYTPSDLRATARNPATQPFVGLLYLSSAITLLGPGTMLKAQVDLGVSGRLSFARETQSLAHWTWSQHSARPRGWDHQLGFAPRVQLTSTLTELAYNSCEKAVPFLCVDAAYRTEVTAGSNMGRLSGGGIARLGHSLPRMGGTGRIEVTAPPHYTEDSKPRIWFFGFLSGDARAVGWNTLLTGHWLADGGSDGWLGNNSITLRRNVTDWSWGVAAGGRWGGVSFQRVTRSPEFDPVGGRGVKHEFGSLTVFLTEPGTRAARE